MSPPPTSLTGVERHFSDDEIIVSKTDPKGWMTYVNDVFLKVSGYTEDEMVCKPHAVIRHPDMPRCVFKLLWDTIKSGQEIFAYVNNRAKNGDNYWVFAHVTPTFDAGHQIIGYHSSRRTPRRDAVAKITPIYQLLIAEENRHEDPKAGLAASTKLLHALLAEKGVSYDQFVLAL